jgi:DNA-binding MarR family transcriptional regulator
MDALIQSLEQLGLGAHEARVYAVLVETSPAGAAQIAKRSGLPRSSVYTTLEILQAKGLVGTTHRDEVKQFVVEGHQALVDHLQREREQAESRIALAERLRDRFVERRSADQPGIIQFAGQDGLRRIYLAMLREAPAGGTLRIVRDEFLWQPEWAFVHERAWMDRVRRLKAHKDLSTELLINASPIEREHRAFYRSRKKHVTRVLPAKLKVEKFALYLVEDAASILSVERGNLVGVKMSDRHLARNLASFFSALWQMARPLR